MTQQQPKHTTFIVIANAGKLGIRLGSAEKFGFIRGKVWKFEIDFRNLILNRLFVKSRA
jgi:hypothetical protein